ncbi:unnamed protein product [Acanthosepion pharaonis]|uniref:Uncharacterized protein n=1 Tax=Acanthosepion pharaonis TaxID=158019 RepID=A0A812CSI5_ACAPH|nr:unnamed protein product [Sepia pharaonis]
MAVPLLFSPRPSLSPAFQSQVFFHFLIFFILFRTRLFSFLGEFLFFFFNFRLPFCSLFPFSFCTPTLSHISFIIRLILLLIFLSFSTFYSLKFLLLRLFLSSVFLSLKLSLKNKLSFSFLFLFSFIHNLYIFLFPSFIFILIILFRPLVSIFSFIFPQSPASFSLSSLYLFLSYCFIFSFPISFLISSSRSIRFILHYILSHLPPYFISYHSLLKSSLSHFLSFFHCFYCFLVYVSFSVFLFTSLFHFSCLCLALFVCFSLSQSYFLPFSVLFLFQSPPLSSVFTLSFPYFSISLSFTFQSIDHIHLSRFEFSYLPIDTRFKHFC